MTKKNLPNIPLYVGDWEKDCNVLSLKSEAAWLRIIFKMHNNGKQSSYKIPTKGLQNLWRCSLDEVKEILEEFEDYNICEVNTDGRYTTLTCRRYLKENKTSQSRRVAVSKRKDRNSVLQNDNKQDTNILQNTENENESDNDIIDKSKSFEKSEKLLVPDQEFLKFVCEFFSQTTEVMQMRVNSVLRALNNKGDLKEFKKQTIAYTQYKKALSEKIHSWNSYQTEWLLQDWEHKLKKLQEKPKTEKVKSASELMREKISL